MTDTSLAYNRDRIVAEANLATMFRMLAEPPDRHLAALAAVTSAQLALGERDYTAARVFLDEARGHLKAMMEGR